MLHVSLFVDENMSAGTSYLFMGFSVNLYLTNDINFLFLCTFTFDLETTVKLRGSLGSLGKRG